MTNYIRNIPVRIQTVEVTQKTRAPPRKTMGWKVYINGAKYPGKPAEYYGENEETSINLAIIDYKKKQGVN